MKEKARIGRMMEMEFDVTAEHVIDFATGGMPAVLSTPRLIGWIERTAREALAPLLDDTERSVGAEIEIRHLAPTPLGARVTCLARVIQTDGATVLFQVEARDGSEVIAKGLHRRAVIQVAAFARRVARKSAVKGA